MNHKITTCISSYNNLNYLKLAIKSVRQNAYYKDMPIIVHTENCTDGSDEWLHRNVDKYNLEVYVETNEISTQMKAPLHVIDEFFVRRF